MSRFLDKREQAAEGLFAHDEELRFLAHRRAVRSLASWGAECMGLEADATYKYETNLVAAFVAGASDERLAMRVASDLERAGKPALSTTASTVLAQAIALASDAVHGRVAPDPAPRRPLEPHYHLFDATLSWRD